MEDFKHELYKFTKQISDSSLKMEYDKIISSFCVDKGDKSIYNQITIARGHQFLTYFISESYKKEAYEKLKMIIPSLNEDEKKAFGRCHSFLLYVDDLLCEDLIKKYPNISEIINPYSNILIKPQRYDISDILHEFDISKLIESFKKTEAFKYIYGYNQKEVQIEKIPKKELTVFYYLVDKEFRESSVDRKMSKDIQNIIMQINNPGNKGLIKLMFCLVSIRYMLSNINQLIYQKFCSEKLFVIDENSIITYTGYGNGYVVLTQNTVNSILIECRDLILFSGIKNSKKLCMIESIEIKFGRDEGGTTKYNLRDIDNELNPLYSIITSKF